MFSTTVTLIWLASTCGLRNSAVLTGYVTTLAQKNQAGAATWSSPDVTQVDNRINVRPY